MKKTFFLSVWVLLAALTGCVTTPDKPLTADIADPAYILYKQAERAYKNENYTLAQEKYQEFVDRFPEDKLHNISMYYLARSYQMNNNPDKARDIYNQIMEKYKDSFWADSAKKRLMSMN